LHCYPKISGCLAYLWLVTLFNHRSIISKEVIVVKNNGNNYGFATMLNANIPIWCFMEKIEQMISNCMHDKDIDKDYLLARFWLIISSDGNIDSLEQEYYDKLCCYLKDNISRVS
jgi:hypothetical protein